MQNIKNQTYTGSAGRENVYDLIIPSNFNQSIILFVHGYKGYKDWGAWQLMEDQFVAENYGFCKFNLSHNGGTVENPIDFTDLVAFSENRYSYEVSDVNTMIDILTDRFPSSKIVLIGHSRGGGDVLLCGKHTSVKAVITLAAISSVSYRFRHVEILEKWKNEGVRYELNSRTKQEMPIKYSQYLDFLDHQDELNIEQSCRELNKPCIHFHGTNDEAILIQEGINIASWTKGPLYILENCNHTFGTSHPWNKSELSEELKFVVNKCISFLVKLN
jgi:uncharacterized protein